MHVNYGHGLAVASPYVVGNVVMARFQDGGSNQHVLAFTRRFYLITGEQNASVQDKHLKQLMYVASVYSSTRNVQKLF